MIIRDKAFHSSGMNILIALREGMKIRARRVPGERCSSWEIANNYVSTSGLTAIEPM